MKQTKCWVCPKCGSKKYAEIADYDCVKGVDGKYYQYYKSRCECGEEYLNVFVEFGAITQNEFNNLINK